MGVVKGTGLLVTLCLLGGMLYGADNETRRSQVSKRRLHLVYNPHAGRQKAAKMAHMAAAKFQAAGIQVELHGTTHAGHARELAKTLPLDGRSGFCVVGGDGTINEAINGLLTREDGRVPLCVIPGGTGNSFMADLGLLDPQAAVEAIIAGRTKQVDVGEVEFSNAAHQRESWYMVNLVGLGLGVDANKSAERMRWLGPARYKLGILWQIAQKRHHAASITIDGGSPVSGDYSIVLVQNTKHGGNGLVLAPRAELDDGMLDLVMAPRLSVAKLLRLFSRIDARGSHVDSPHVAYQKFHHLELKSTGPSELEVNIDGENCGTTPLSIKVLASQLSVFY